MGIRKNLGDFASWRQNLPGSFYGDLGWAMVGDMIAAKVQKGEYSGQPRFAQLDNAANTYRLGNNIFDFEDDEESFDSFEAYLYLRYRAFAKKAGEEPGPYVNVNADR